jgi:hypothetical protein
MVKAELRASTEAVRPSEALFAAQRHDMEQKVLPEASAVRSAPDSNLLRDETDEEIVTIGTLPADKCQDSVIEFLKASQNRTYLLSTSNAEDILLAFEEQG